MTIPCKNCISLPTCIGRFINGNDIVKDIDAYTDRFDLLWWMDRKYFVMDICKDCIKNMDDDRPLFKIKKYFIEFLVNSEIKSEFLTKLRKVYENNEDEYPDDC